MNKNIAIITPAERNKMTLKEYLEKESLNLENKNPISNISNHEIREENNKVYKLKK